jgi:hypothetical protein
VKPRFAAARLLALFRKRHLDRELEGEILAHLEMAELDAVAAGLSPEEARRQARRGFGGIEQMKEDHRDYFLRRVVECSAFSAGSNFWTLRALGSANAT